LAKQTTEPGEAEETADCAAVVLVTVVVHPSLGGGGVTSSSASSASTAQLRAAGVASTFLEASTLRTENWCEPIATPE
jgi:hypothetical protein